jgi:NTE family protein
MAQGRPPGVGVVISGAGARGAYEAGVLSVVLPWLVEQGVPARLLVGTSAGAINTAAFGALCRPDTIDTGVAAALDTWRTIGRENVFRSVLVTGPVSLVRYLTSVTGLASRLPGRFGDDGLTSLLDVSPLVRTLRRYEHWDDLHDTVDAGYLDAVAAVATSLTSGGTDVFVESTAGFRLPSDDRDRSLRYLDRALGPDEVLASSAIPVAFPPVRLGEAWYVDGGVRLNTPIKPALALGAQRLVVVATHPLSDDVRDEDAEPLYVDADDAPATPDVFTAFSSVLVAALVDRMVEDVRNLERVNRLVRAGARDDRYRVVPHLFVAPRRRSAIADLAAEVLSSRYDGLAGLFGGDYTVFNWLVGGTTTAHAELLSFVLFDEEFIEQLITLGRQDALDRIAATGEELLEQSGAASG